MKKVLSIAGSDCSGGAGVQADLKTFSAHGVFGMSVIVSVVAENTSRVIDIQDVSPDMVESQMDAVFEDIEVDAVKIGMLSSPECMRAVAGRLRKYCPVHVVADPVMYAKNGCPLMEETAVDALRKWILPVTDVLTPNIPEAEKLADMQILSTADMEEAARRIQGMGCRSVVVKGGHALGSALDILFDGKQFYYFEAERIDTKNTHGTGCTFSSAIASNLALGMGIKDAVRFAKDYVTTAIVHSLSIGKGNGPTHHFYELYRHGLHRMEKRCRKFDYSLYLVTDRARMSTATLCEAVEQAILGGCSMVQLRETDLLSIDFYRQAEEVRKVTARYDIPLIINNRPDIALAVGADGVHIGQKDLPASAVREIIGPDMLLGVSASSLQEAVQAQKDGADYLGVGAMLPTRTKKDARLVSMRELCAIRQAVRLPMVAIGGINKENAAEFMRAGVNGLAVVSAIIAQPDIRAAAAELRGIVSRERECVYFENDQNK